MKSEIKKSLRIASLFVACGLYVSFIVFFFLFGKGMQILMPGILLGLFFVIFLVLEKLPFVRSHPFVKVLLATASVCVVALFL